jgi:hypothetical protein
VNDGRRVNALETAFGVIAVGVFLPHERVRNALGFLLAIIAVSACGPSFAASAAAITIAAGFNGRARLSLVLRVRVTNTRSPGLQSSKPAMALTLMSFHRSQLASNGNLLCIRRQSRRQSY